MDKRLEQDDFPTNSYDAGFLNSDIPLRERQTAEHEGIPPLVRLNYAFKHPFNNICMAYMRRFNWEGRQQLSTIAHVEQPDDDTLVYYRRQE